MFRRRPLTTETEETDAVVRAADAPTHGRGIWTPVTRFALLIVLSGIVSTIVGAVTGEKTTFLYKDVLHLSASQLGSLSILLGFPSYIQPFAGGWTDVFPLFRYHRRSYYVVGVLGIVGANAGLALMHSYHLWSVVCLLLLGGSFGIFATVVKQAVMVAIGNRTGNFGRFQSLLIFVPYVLRLGFASHLGGYVAQNWSYASAYTVAAALTLLLLPLVFLLQDTRVGEHVILSPIVHDEMAVDREVNKARLKEAMKSPGLWATVAFVFYLILTPGPNTTYFWTDGLHLSKQFIGDNGRWLSAGALAGMFLFAAASRRMPVIALVLGAWLLDCAIYPCMLGMRGPVSVNVFSLIYEAANTTYGLCLNTIAARACPPGIEGTVYGLAMAALALAGTLQVWMGNLMYDFFGPANHHSVIYGWNASQIVGLLFTIPAGLLIPFLPGELKSRKPLRLDPEAKP